jgi:hypothetical protein
MKESDFFTNEEIESESQPYLEPISSNPLPSDTTTGSVLSFQDTLKDNND